MMRARETILNELKSTIGDAEPHLHYEVTAITYSNKTERFVQAIEANGGKIIETNDKSTIENFIHAERDAGKYIQYIQKGEKINCAHAALYNIDTAIIKGETAVAENGAIWISENNIGHRLLPFTCKQLVLIVEEKNIVHNLQEAYEIINMENEGYGIFISGPSKTADIEQSLVIGAHGAINHLVILIKC
ncbi:MAG: L-lactate utilization protein LutC [Bacteroidota bacterium]|jgi:L-lactate dehydrogenase complex protein LldG